MLEVIAIVSAWFILFLIGLIFIKISKIFKIKTFSIRFFLKIYLKVIYANLLMILFFSTILFYLFYTLIRLRSLSKYIFILYVFFFRINFLS
jgi:hypothetical protein